VLGQSMRFHRFLKVHKMFLVPIVWLFVIQWLQLKLLYCGLCPALRRKALLHRMPVNF
jgi:hypothetical protein